MKIAFLVNNDGISDTRVVKTATVAAAAGFECTVIGCSRERTAPRLLEEDGVRYLVLPLKRSYLLGWLATSCSTLYSRGVIAFRRRPLRLRAEPASAARSRYTELKFKATSAFELEVARVEKSPSYDDDVAAPQLPWFKQLLKPVVGLLRRVVRVVTSAYPRARRQVVLSLQPARSVFGVKALFGNYLRTFYPALVCEDWDVVYCHELWTLETGALMRMVKADQTLFYDSHELEQHRNNNWSTPSNSARTAYEDKYIRGFDGIATVCQSIAEYIERSYSLDELPSVVPNAPTAATLRDLPGGSKLKARLGIGKDPLLVYTGKVTTGRGLPQVLRALGELPEVHLAIVGPRVAAVAQELVLLAETLSVGRRVHFVDAVPPEWLISFISDADLAVVPIENVCLSYYYALPNKMFEAAMAGLPILASNFPELERFVARWDAGLCVDFLDVGAVQTGVRTLLATGVGPRGGPGTQQIRDSLSFDRALSPVLTELTA